MGLLPKPFLEMVSPPKKPKNQEMLRCFDRSCFDPEEILIMMYPAGKVFSEDIHLHHSDRAVPQIMLSINAGARIDCYLMRMFVCSSNPA